MPSRLADPSPNPDEHGVVVAEEVGAGEVGADLHAVAEADAEPLDRADLGDAHLGTHLVDGDPVGVESAAFRSPLEHGDVVAEVRQFGGTAQPGGTGTHHRDPAAMPGRGGGEQMKAECRGMVGRVALQATDVDRPPREVEHHAGAFAEHLGRADTRAAATEHVGLEDRPRGSGDVAGGDLVDEGGDVDPGRTGLDARRVVAIEAARGLRVRLLRRQRRLDVGQRRGGGGGVAAWLDRHPGTSVAAGLRRQRHRERENTPRRLADAMRIG